MPCTRRAKVASICWGDWSPLGCRGHYFEHFMTLVVAPVVLYAVVCCGGCSAANQTVKEGQLCPGLSAGLHRGGGWEEDVSQANVNHGQHFPPRARLWKPRAALSAADSYTHRVRRSATADLLFPQTPDFLTQALPQQSLSTTFFDLFSF